MTPRKLTFAARCVLCLFVTGLALVGCGSREPSGPLEDPLFEVDLDQLGPAHTSNALGVTFRPPVEWIRLEGDQRQAVLDALSTGIEEDAFVADVREVFFNTDTLSFLALAAIRIENGRADRDEYAESFAGVIGLDDRPASDSYSVVARMDFSVNDVPVIQFRHVQSNRVNFTLIFNGSDGQLVQFDYSIPTESYQRESLKLESSIGSIHLVES